MSRQAAFSGDWMHEAFAGFAEEKIRGCLGRDSDVIPDEGAISAAISAFVKALRLNHSLSRFFSQLEAISPGGEPWPYHARLILDIDRKPECLTGDVIIERAFPELFLLIGKVLGTRQARGRAAFDIEADLDLLICLAWPHYMHRASKAAGCALLSAHLGKPVTLEAYLKASEKMALRSSSKDITLANVANQVPLTAKFLPKIRTDAEKRRIG